MNGTAQAAGRTIANRAMIARNKIGVAGTDLCPIGFEHRSPMRKPRSSNPETSQPSNFDIGSRDG
jgi:hypothetical protein